LTYGALEDIVMIESVLLETSVITVVLVVPAPEVMAVEPEAALDDAALVVFGAAAVLVVAAAVLVTEKVADLVNCSPAWDCELAMAEASFDEALAVAVFLDAAAAAFEDLMAALDLATLVMVAHALERRATGSFLIGLVVFFFPFR